MLFTTAIYHLKKKMEEREVVEEEEMKPEMALSETHQIPSDIPTEVYIIVVQYSHDNTISHTISRTRESKWGLLKVRMVERRNLR